MVYWISKIVLKTLYLVEISVWRSYMVLRLLVVDNLFVSEVDQLGRFTISCTNLECKLSQSQTRKGENQLSEITNMSPGGELETARRK